MEQKHIGIVGMGQRGSLLAHESATHTSGLLKPVATVDPSEESVTSAKDKYGLDLKRYDSVPDMLKAETLDGIVISSPNDMHLQNLRELGDRSLPVLCEKPLDSSWEKISDVVRFCEAHGAPVVVGHCMRYAPILDKAKELVLSGAIGEVCSARFVQYCHYGNVMCHNWRRSFEASGGMMIEKATHDIDVMDWLVGAQPVSVYAVGRQQAYGGSKPDDLRCRDCDERMSCPESVQNIKDRWGLNMIDEAGKLDKQDLCVFAKATTVNDNETCVVQFANGCVGTYTQIFFSPRSYRHRVYETIGTEGAMEIDLGAETGGKILLCKRFGAVKDREEFAFDYLNRNHYNGDGRLMRHFYRVIADGEAPETTARQAYIAEAACMAANRSVAEGRNVTVEELIPEDLRHITKEELFGRDGDQA